MSLLRGGTLRERRSTVQNRWTSTPPFAFLVGETAEHDTNGLRLRIEYDNRDYRPSPSRGSLQGIGVARDFGWFDSVHSWTAFDGEYRKYVGFGSTKHSRQRALAFRAWTAYSPTFDREVVGSTIVVRNSPPSNMGASLGGQERLRAYPLGRFSDRAAVYYSAEYRVIPKWDPIGKTKFARGLHWRWWQWVLITEIGRVAPSWNLELLHEDMKWSAGAAARVMIGSRVFSFNLETSEESTQFQFTVGQPF